MVRGPSNTFTKRAGVPAYDKADPDEPVFLLRAQDLVAPCIVELYALHVSMLHVNSQKVQSVRECAAAMRKWQAAHANVTKLPD